MGFCFVHAADLHLDTPFEGVGTVSPAVAEALREASLESFDRLVRLTLERGAEFLVLAGDIYDGVRRGVRAQLRFLQGLQRLSDAGIEVFVAHGNHDPVGGWTGVREWPALVRVFGSEAVEGFPVRRDGRVVAHVSGISYGRPDVTENLALRFTSPSALGEGAASGDAVEAVGGRVLRVGVLHCNVGGDPSHAPYSPCSLDDLVRTGHDYWALGHVHKRSVLRAGKPWVVYSGGTQGRSLKPSERGAKGACVVHVEAGSVTEVEPVAVDGVRFGVVEVDAAAVTDLGSLRSALLAAADGVRADAEGRPVVLRGIVHGRGPVHGDLSCAGGVDGLVRELREGCEAESPFVWWESVHDRTRAELDLDRVRARGDFSAALVERVDALIAEEAEPPGPGAGADGLDGAAQRRAASRLPTLEAEEARALLEEARALALDLLEDEADVCT